MSRIIQLHLWMRDKKERWVEPEVVNNLSGNPTPGKRIVIDIDTDNLMEMKLAVAKELRPWIDKLKYYYVVAVRQAEDGSVTYRMVVRKQMIEEDSDRYRYE